MIFPDIHSSELNELEKSARKTVRGVRVTLFPLCDAGERKSHCHFDPRNFALDNSRFYETAIISAFSKLHYFSYRILVWEKYSCYDNDIHVSNS